MTTVPIYQVDAFAAALFAGNPAAVCPLDAWLDDAILQAIATENNLAETAFFVPREGGYHLRWFTPTNEVDLCGHATLASAFVVFEYLRPRADAVVFSTRSGELTVTRAGSRLELDFPAIPAAPCDPPAALLDGLRTLPSEIRLGSNWMAVYETAARIAALAPDMAALARLHPAGIIATAPADPTDGQDAPDFVSRFFAPSHGIPEDSVTGSAHCSLVPYWSARLGKARLVARQISARGGVLYCEARGGRVGIAGEAVLYLEGTIRI
jgi:predicted PhzF superfamily epimerase YddE/YHI9